jgi:hypothetical protein
MNAGILPVHFMMRSCKYLMDHRSIKRSLTGLELALQTIPDPVDFHQTIPSLSTQQPASRRLQTASSAVLNVLAAEATHHNALQPPAFFRHGRWPVPGLDLPMLMGAAKITGDAYSG